MRKLKLSAVLAALLVTSAIAGAGVVGTLSVAGQLLVADASATLRPAASTRAFVDGRIPVRLQKVVDGALVPATQAAVTFARDGQAVVRSEEMEGSTVQTDGLAQGGYSVFVRSNEGFAAFATWIGLPSESDGATGSVISVGMVPTSDMPTVRRLIRERIPSSESTPTVAPEFFTSAPSPTSSRSLTHGGGFELSADGTLRGRVVRASQDDGKSTPLEASRVYFVRGNQVVGEAVSDAEGLFTIRGLASGVYSLVVTKRSSFVAISVSVAPTSTTVAAQTVPNNLSLVAFDGPVEIHEYVEVPEVCMCYEEDVFVCEESFEEVYEEHATDEFAGCCGSGSSGGGGGGYGGGGGFGAGALLFGAALGAGIYAIAEDDDDPRRVVSPPAP